MKDQQKDAICLTLGQNFIRNVYPGGENQIRKMLERMNESDQFIWMQFCGSGIPTAKIELCYLVWDGKVQYRCDIKEFIAKQSGGFYDGGVYRSFSNRNLCVLQGPTLAASHTHERLSRI